MPKCKARVRHYIGIDPSATSTGVAIISVLRDSIVRAVTHLTAKNYSGPERLYLLCNAFEKFIENELSTKNNIQGICIEAPSLGSTNRADTLGQIRGALNVTCMRCFGHPQEIPPTSLKKFFAGTGTADKDKMLNAALKQGWNVDNDDEADAAGLAELAWSLDDDTRSLTRKQLEAIVGIQNMNQQKPRPHFDNNGINI